MLSVKHKPKTTLALSADQITQIAGNAATYDLRGNLTAYEINGKDYSLEYDLDNRITKVTVDNDEVEYRYDAFGRRIIRQEGNTKSALIWWGDSECAEHKHRAGQTVIQNDIMSHPTRLNSVIARAVEGSKFKLQWYHKNYLDHVYAVSDKSGNILEHYRYTAFGEVTIYNDNGQLLNKSAIDNTILWNTRRKDEVSGYYMYKYRHYAPELGRWPSRDPIGEKGGENLYAFVGNEPIRRWDRLGLAPSTRELRNKTRRVRAQLAQLRKCLEKNKGCPQNCKTIYDLYLNMINDLTRSAGDFYDDNSWFWGDQRNAYDNAIQRFPTNFDEFDITKTQLDEMSAANQANLDAINNSFEGQYGDQIENGANFAGGFSDGVLFGQGETIAGWVYGDNATWADTDSGWYTGGQWTGVAATSIGGVRAASSAAGGIRNIARYELGQSWRLGLTPQAGKALQSLSAVEKGTIMLNNAGGSYLRAFAQNVGVRSSATAVTRGLPTMPTPLGGTGLVNAGQATGIIFDW